MQVGVKQLYNQVPQTAWVSQFEFELQLEHQPFRIKCERYSFYKEACSFVSLKSSLCLIMFPLIFVYILCICIMSIQHIYIYIYVCVCVCVCVFLQHFFLNTHLIEYYRLFCQISFVNPFELPYWLYDIRWELVDKSSIISYFPSTFCPTLYIALYIYIYIYIYSHSQTDLFRSIRTHQWG